MKRSKQICIVQQIDCVLASAGNRQDEIILNYLWRIGEID